MNRFRRLVPTSAQFYVPTGLLDTPVSIVRSSRAPTGDADFLQTLTPVLPQAWAKMEQAEQSFSDKKPTDNATHIFHLRDPHISLESRDYIVRGRELYAIVGVKPMGTRPAFLRLRAMYHKTIPSTPADDNIVVVTDAIVPDNEPAPTSPTLFWSYPPPSE